MDIVFAGVLLPLATMLQLEQSVHCFSPTPGLLGTASWKYDATVSWSMIHGSVMVQFHGSMMVQSHGNIMVQFHGV